MTAKKTPPAKKAPTPAAAKPTTTTASARPPAAKPPKGAKKSAAPPVQPPIPGIEETPPPPVNLPPIPPPPADEVGVAGAAFTREELRPRAVLHFDRRSGAVTRVDLYLRDVLTEAIQFAAALPDAPPADPTTPEGPCPLPGETVGAGESVEAPPPAAAPLPGELDRVEPCELRVMIAGTTRAEVDARVAELAAVLGLGAAEVLPADDENEFDTAIFEYPTLIEAIEFGEAVRGVPYVRGVDAFDPHEGRLSDEELDRIDAQPRKLFVSQEPRVYCSKCRVIGRAPAAGLVETTAAGFSCSHCGYPEGTPGAPPAGPA